MDTIWKELQSNVDHVLDREMKSGNPSTKVGWGFKQLIERKSGIFRMHMMGKRVNFAARTVITPDPNINIDEIGLPEVFAKKLSYREPVTAYNVDMLREMVMNGPDVHPGRVKTKVNSRSIFVEIKTLNSLFTLTENSRELLGYGFWESVLLVYVRAQELGQLVRRTGPG